MIEKDAGYWIQRLSLTPHPEGGCYRPTYRSDLSLGAGALPAQFTGSRAASTAIFFLLDGDDFSAFHRLRSDEMWHFYSGSSLLVHVIERDGRYTQISMGSDADAGEVFQAVVKAGCWFASELRGKKSFALVGCTVAPAFDFADFELAERAGLIEAYPQHREIIEKLTRS